MEGMTISLISVFAVFISWGAWATIKIFSLEKDVAVNTSNDLNVTAQIQSVKNDLSIKVDKFETHVNQKFEKIDSKFEMVFDKIDLLRK